jgi:hypothetical protein
MSLCIISALASLSPASSTWLQVYVEHSNEVWNTGFPQGRHATEQGLKLGLAADNATARYRYHARR